MKLMLIAAMTAVMAAGCGSAPSRAVRRCAAVWNRSIARPDALGDIVSGTEANVSIVHGRCFVTLMGERQRSIVFRDGYALGVGGFLFQGSADPQELPAWQRRANASLGLHYRLDLTS